MKNNKLYLAMVCYIMLGSLAWFTLDGSFRLATLIFLGGLAVKTWLVTLRRDQE
jgi:hypothetical protein